MFTAGKTAIALSAFRSLTIDNPHMITTSIPPVVPAAFSEFKDMFHKLEQPYKRDDVVRFNLLYQQVYPSLSPTEKQNAEILADELIQGLEHENPGPSIYGITDL